MYTYTYIHRNSFPFGHDILLCLISIPMLVYWRTYPNVVILMESDSLWDGMMYPPIGETPTYCSEMILHVAQQFSRHCGVLEATNHSMIGVHPTSETSSKSAAGPPDVGGISRDAVHHRRPVFMVDDLGFAELVSC